MNKKFLIIGIIVAAVLITGGAFFIKSRKVSNQSVLSDNTQNEIQEETPVLEIFSGDVEIKTGSKDFVQATDKQKVSVGDVIKTGADGRAQVLYPTHSVTRIDFNSQMTVETYTKSPSVTKVKLDDGRIWSRVAKLFGKDDSNSTKTDTLVASVRGTSYGLGILTDGNNKISVIKSTVNVLCNTDNTKTTDVTINNKLITKCQNKLSSLKFDNTENNDEWIKFNADQDKILDARFPDAFNDEPSPTPTPKPTLKPTATPQVKAASTTAPTASPTPVTTATPNSTPTPLTITSVDFICGRVQEKPCSDGAVTELKVTGTNFSAGGNPTISVISQNNNASPAPSPTPVPASSVVVNPGGDGTLVAKFNTSLHGSYTMTINQYGQSASKDFQI